VLGAHGGMQQKWHNAYQETIHIPCVISHPRLFPKTGVDVYDVITSAVDLLPTMLSLAKISLSHSLQMLTKTHSIVQPLVGKDLTWLFSSSKNNPFYQQKEDGTKNFYSNKNMNGIYFMTNDEILNGERKEYAPIEGPCHVESIVVFLNQPFQKPHLCKISRYWINPLIKQIFPSSSVPQKEKEQEEWEMYDLTNDPSELINLASPKYLSNHDHERLFHHLSKLLHSFHANIYKTQTTQIIAKL